MTDEKRRPRPATQQGPTAAAVAANIRRVRERRGMTIYQVSSALKRADRAISPSAVAKIERQERQVSVDDLMALSAVFNVSPSALLLPLEDSPTATVGVTGAGEIPADIAWDWVDGRRPLYVSSDDTHTEALEYDLYSRPPRRRRSWESLKDLITVVNPESHAAGLVGHLKEEDADEPGVD